MIDAIETIKERYDLLDLVSRETEMRSRGGRWWGLCPFHSERTASFTVRETDAGYRYHCFGCNESGDVIDYFAKTAGLDNAEAIRRMAEEKGIEFEPRLKPPKTPPVRRPALVTVPPPPPPAGSVPDYLAEWWERRGFRRNLLLQLAAEGTVSWAEPDSGREFIRFHFEHGVKTRHDLSDSRSCRWEDSGDINANLLRGRFLDCPAVRKVGIFEGETDLFAWMSRHPECYDTLGIAAPGASWNCDPVLAWRIGEGREVRIHGDNDESGYAFMNRFAVLAKKECTSVSVTQFAWSAHMDAPRGADVDWLIREGRI